MAQQGLPLALEVAQLRNSSYVLLVLPGMWVGAGENGATTLG
jgi:hypothetical protein